MVKIFDKCRSMKKLDNSINRAVASVGVKQLTQGLVQRALSNVQKTAKPRSRPKRANRVIYSGTNAPITELACSVTNPFECSACIPDGSTNTGCFSVKQQFSLGTGTGGSCCSLFVVPEIDQFYYPDNGSVNATPTISGNWTQPSAYSTIVGQYQMIRPVSLGIRGEYVSNTQTDQGVIVVGQISGQEAISNFNGITLSTFCSKLSSYKTFPLRGGFQVTWRPEAQEDQDEWYSCGGSAAAVTGAVFHPVLCMAVFGANAAVATIVTGEIVANYEGMFKLQSYVPGGVSQQKKSTVPAVVGWYETAKNIYNKVEPYLPFLSALLGLNSPSAMLMGNGMAYSLGAKSQKRLL